MEGRRSLRQQAGVPSLAPSAGPAHGSVNAEDPPKRRRRERGESDFLSSGNYFSRTDAASSSSSDSETGSDEDQLMEEFALRFPPKQKLSFLSRAGLPKKPDSAKPGSVSGDRPPQLVPGVSATTGAPPIPIHNKPPLPTPKGSKRRPIRRPLVSQRRACLLRCLKTYQPYRGMDLERTRSEQSTPPPVGLGALWAEVLPFVISGFLDLKSVVRLRQCCRRLYFKRRYSIASCSLETTPSLTEQELIAKVLPSIHGFLTAASFSQLNFSRCCLITDSFPRSILSFEGGKLRRHLHSLFFDFCYALTDKALETLLMTSLPNLETLSLRCARSKDLTGTPFSQKDMLSKERWPRFHQFSCSCTQKALTNLDAVAFFIAERAVELGLPPKLGMAGSLASHSLIKRLGLEAEHTRFIEGIVLDGTSESVEAAIGAFEKQWLKAIDESDTIKADGKEDGNKTQQAVQSFNPPTLLTHQSTTPTNQSAGTAANGPFKLDIRFDPKAKVLHRLLRSRSVSLLMNAPCSMAVVDDGAGHEKAMWLLMGNRRLSGVRYEQHLRGLSAILPSYDLMDPCCRCREAATGMQMPDEAASVRSGQTSLGQGSVHVATLTGLASGVTDATLPFTIDGSTGWSDMEAGRAANAKPFTPRSSGHSSEHPSVHLSVRGAGAGEVGNPGALSLMVPDDRASATEAETLGPDDMNSKPVNYTRWSYPLPMAIRLGNLPVVDLLLQRGAHVDVWGHTFATPLYVAVANVHKERGTAATKGLIDQVPGTTNMQDRCTDQTTGVSQTAGVTQSTGSVGVPNSDSDARPSNGEILQSHQDQPIAATLLKSVSGDDEFSSLGSAGMTHEEGGGVAGPAEIGVAAEKGGSEPSIPAITTLPGIFDGSDGVDALRQGPDVPLGHRPDHEKPDDRVSQRQSVQEGAAEKGSRHYCCCVCHRFESSLIVEEEERKLIVERLLKAGSPVDAPDPFSIKCPINAAIKNQNLPLVERLIRLGARTNVRSLAAGILPAPVQYSRRQQEKKHPQRGLARLGYKSPLFVACEFNVKPCIEVLLDGGADPHWKDPFSNRNVTPTLVAYRKDPENVHLFLKKGAGSTKATRWVWSEVLAVAILQDDIRTVGTLVSTYPDLLEKESSGMWSLPLIQAARLNKVPVLKKLLSLGADPNALNSQSLSALHLAASEGHKQAIECLLQHKARPDIAGGQNARTPLHVAAEENRRDVAEILLSFGASIACKDADGLTPLMIASAARNDKVVMLMVQHGRTEDLDIPDNSMRTPLMYAIYFGQFKAASALVDKGVSCRAQDLSGCTAEQLLKQKVQSLGQTGTASTINKILRNIVGAGDQPSGAVRSKDLGEIPPADGPQGSEQSVRKLNAKRKKIARRLLKKVRARAKKDASSAAASSAVTPTTSPSKPSDLITEGQQPQAAIPAAGALRQPDDNSVGGAASITRLPSKVGPSEEPVVEPFLRFDSKKDRLIRGDSPCLVDFSGGLQRGSGTQFDDHSLDCHWAPTSGDDREDDLSSASSDSESSVGSEK